MKDGAPLLHDDLITEGVKPVPTKPSNIAKRIDNVKGDVDAGFKQAEVVVEREFTTQPVHQGYIEPHALPGQLDEDGQLQIWSTTQGHFQVRGFCSRLLNIETSQIRVTPTEIGGGFGGKTVVYLEPVAASCRRSRGKPVKMMMSRDEVFEATGPTPGGTVQRQARREEGRHARRRRMHGRAAGRRLPGLAGRPGAAGPASPATTSRTSRSIGYDVVSNKPEGRRLPRARRADLGVRRRIDDRHPGAGTGHRPDRAPPQERRQGRHQPLRPGLRRDRLRRVPGGGQELRALQEQAQAGHGARRRGRLLVQRRRRSRARPRTSAEDGTVTLIAGSPDIGGSRASLAMMAAEALGIDDDKVRPVVADTDSSASPSSPAAAASPSPPAWRWSNSARDLIRECKVRAAKIWDVEPEDVIWENGSAKPAGSNVGEFEPLSLAQLAATAGKTGGPIDGHDQLNAQGAGPGFGVAHRRRRGRPRDRQGRRSSATPPCRTPARRSIPATSKARCRAAPCRASAGR